MQASHHIITKKPLFAFSFLALALALGIAEKSVLWGNTNTLGTKSPTQRVTPCFFFCL